MNNGIEIKKNIEVTLSIDDVFDEEDYLPDGYDYTCKNGLEIHYGYSKSNYQSIIPFISACSIWFPYKEEKFTDTTVSLNDYSIRKEFYEDWEEFYNYLKNRHKKKLEEKFKLSAETIETPLYKINYTEKDNYITDITLTIDSTLFWGEEPTSSVSRPFEFCKGGWTFIYNTTPSTISCILGNFIREVWFRGNEHVLHDKDIKISKGEFRIFLDDVDSFVHYLAAKGKSRKSCEGYLVINQIITEEDEIITKFTFTIPPHTKFLKYGYEEGNWTFCVDNENEENFISMTTKQAFLSFGDNNKATCVCITKETPLVSELEEAYNAFLDEVMTEDCGSCCLN